MNKLCFYTKIQTGRKAELQNLAPTSQVSFKKLYFTDNKA